MIRITTLLWIALLVVAGGTVMRVSYQVRHMEKHLSELARDTRQEQDAIRILGAEWDTLNDPRRIDGLSKRYLTLESTPIARVVSLESLPLRPSDDQLARLVAAQTAKNPKGQVPASKKPAVLVSAPGSQPAAGRPRAVAQPTPTTVAHAPLAQPAPDGVGLILAKMERHE
jgi:hypothetical protein